MERLIKRTDGISTTDLVGRMLLSSKRHYSSDSICPQYESSELLKNEFLTTSSKIVQFATARTPKVFIFHNSFFFSLKFLYV
jgi:hypothetical protein